MALPKGPLALPFPPLKALYGLTSIGSDRMFLSTSEVINL